VRTDSLRTFNKPLIPSLHTPPYADEVKNSVRPLAAGYLYALVVVAAVTCSLLPFRGQINSTTIALGLLLVILFVAMIWGSGPALFASVLGMLAFNFFFLPPFHTFTISDPQNWVALAAFFMAALAVGQLSARAKKRAEEAEAGRIEIRRLYEELREAFDRASEAEAFKKSERLKSAQRDRLSWISARTACETLKLV
jgi:two-component system sensor histidine kinase KdpD